MKTLAILDSDSLDLALGGVGRAMPGQQLGSASSGPFLGVSKFADSFGFSAPVEARTNLEDVLGSLGADAGADSTAADGGWCGNHGTGGGSGMGPGASDGSGGGSAGDIAQEVADVVDAVSSFAEGGCVMTFPDDATTEVEASSADADATGADADGGMCGTEPEGSWDDPGTEAPSTEAQTQTASNGSWLDNVMLPADSASTATKSGGWFDNVMLPADATSSVERGSTNLEVRDHRPTAAAGSDEARVDAFADARDHRGGR